jgi:hypothetical protein
MSEPDECFIESPMARADRRKRHRRDALRSLVELGREHVSLGGADDLEAYLGEQVQDYGFDQDEAKDVVDCAYAEILKPFEGSR